MMKLIGGLLLVIGGWGFGSYLITREHCRMRAGEAMLDLLRFIRAQVGSFCRTRADIFSLYENEYLGETGFLISLRESGSITDAMRNSFVGAEGEIKEIMLQFDREFGRTYVEGQLATCDYYIARLEAHLASQSASRPARMRVQRTITLAGALMLMLLLL